MRTKLQHAKLLLLALIALLPIVVLGAWSVLYWPHWREYTICRAMIGSERPAFWWPASWRQELRTSTLLEGNLLKTQTGTVEYKSALGGMVFSAPVVKARYSFNRRRLPAGKFLVRFVAPDGSATKWVGPLELDGGGRHRLNLDF